MNECSWGAKNSGRLDISVESLRGKQFSNIHDGETGDIKYRALQSLLKISSIIRGG